MKATTAGTFGLAMITLAALAAPAWARPTAIPAAICVAASVLPRTWPPTVTLAAASSVLLTATGHPGTPLTAAEGMLILGYLVSADQTDIPAGTIQHHWPVTIAAAATTAIVVAVLLLPPGPATYLVLAGAAAVAVAYALAVSLR